MAKNRASQVYFIGAPNGLIKIGEALDPAYRLATLQTGSPLPLSLLATCPGGRGLEQTYHRRFEAQRVHGEWFSASPELEKLISSVAADGSGFCQCCK